MDDGLPYFGSDNMRSVDSDNGGKIDVNSALLPFKNESLGLALNRTISFNPHTDRDVDMRSNGVETP